jgi:hypothetical protein
VTPEELTRECTALYRAARCAGEREATRTADYAVAYETARRRLGRVPTDSEVLAVLRNM